MTIKKKGTTQKRPQRFCVVVYITNSNITIGTLFIPIVITTVKQRDDA